MQYDVTSPEEYLDALEEDWRKEKLLRLRAMLFEADPDLLEVIQYKMLSYSDKDGVICHLNAQKHFVGLYVGNADKIDVDGTLLEGINRGKGCLRLNKTLDLEKTQIGEFIKRTITAWKSGADIGC
ncbi:MAG: DUF1801 domain-containing protein [Bacteroidia bacterium]|nr:DUF1801 domain-containing protein [Bacteroidia bacterium]